MFKPGKTYEFIRNTINREPIKGKYVKTMKNNNIRFAVFEKDTRTWWIPEKLWKYIKEVKDDA